MNQLQRTALIDSIAHWEDNVALIKQRKDPQIYCPCCKAFSDVFSCGGCPIAEYGGDIQCLPVAWGDVQLNVGPTSDKGWADLQQAAERELTFLEEILINDGVNPAVPQHDSRLD